jgi:GPH family glycoside/pentoside/hexuronide:cation symporter
VVSLPGWIWVSRKLGKKNAFLIGCALFVPSQLSWFWATAHEAAWILFIRTVAMGFASGALLAMSQSILPDTIDVDRRTSGLNREGIYAGFTTTVDKLTIAAGVAIVGVVLAMTHYVKATTAQVIQPKSAIDGINLCFVTLPSVLMAVSALIMLPYKLDEASLNAMAAEPASAAA